MVIIHHLNPNIQAKHQIATDSDASTGGYMSGITPSFVSLTTSPQKSSIWPHCWKWNHRQSTNQEAQAYLHFFFF